MPSKLQNCFLESHQAFRVRHVHWRLILLLGAVAFILSALVTANCRD